MSRRSGRTALLGILAVALVGGCYRTTVRSGLPPGDAPDDYDRTWHSGFLLGFLETGGPYPVREICPQGWAEVHTSTNILQGLLTLVTYGIYTPQNVTVVCASPGVPGPRLGQTAFRRYRHRFYRNAGWFPGESCEFESPGSGAGIPAR